MNHNIRDKVVSVLSCRRQHRADCMVSGVCACNLARMTVCDRNPCIKCQAVSLEYFFRRAILSPLATVGVSVNKNPRSGQNRGIFNKSLVRTLCLNRRTVITYCHKQHLSNLPSQETPLRQNNGNLSGCPDGRLSAARPN